MSNRGSGCELPDFKPELRGFTDRDPMMLNTPPWEVRTHRDLDAHRKITERNRPQCELTARTCMHDFASSGRVVVPDLCPWDTTAGTLRHNDSAPGDNSTDHNLHAIAWLDVHLVVSETLGQPMD